MTISVPSLSSSTHLVAGEAPALGTAAGLCRLRDYVAAAPAAHRLVIAMPALTGVDDELRPGAVPRGAEARAAIQRLLAWHHAVACAVLPASEASIYELEVMHRLTTVRGWWSRLAADPADTHRAADGIGAAGPRLAASLLARRLRLDGYGVRVAEPVVVSAAGGPSTLHVRRTWQALHAWSTEQPTDSLTILPLGVARTPAGAARYLRGDQRATLHRLLAIALGIDAVDYWTAPARAGTATDPLLEAGIPVRVQPVTGSDRPDDRQRRARRSAPMQRMDAADLRTHPCAPAA